MRDEGKTEEAKALLRRLKVWQMKIEELQSQIPPEETVEHAEEPNVQEMHQKEEVIQVTLNEVQEVRTYLWHYLIDDRNNCWKLKVVLRNLNLLHCKQKRRETRTKQRISCCASNSLRLQRQQSILVRQ